MLSSIAATPKFAMLLDLAKEPSSDKRRDLLRQVTDTPVCFESVTALYQAVPMDAAMRAVRFWKVRALI